MLMKIFKVKKPNKVIKMKKIHGVHKKIKINKWKINYNKPITHGVAKIMIKMWLKIKIKNHKMLGAVKIKIIKRCLQINLTRQKMIDSVIKIIKKWQKINLINHKIFKVVMIINKIFLIINITKCRNKTNQKIIKMNKFKLIDSKIKA